MPGSPHQRPTTGVPVAPDAGAAAPEGAALPVYDSARRPHPFVEEWLNLFRYRDLIVQWSLRNLKIRYKRSALGVLWTLLEPLMIMAILTVVFSQAFRSSLEGYPVYVLSGLLMWDFFRRSTVGMMDEIIDSQTLAKRIYLPRSAFAVASIITYLLNWILAMVPLLGIMLVLGRPFSWALLAVPAGMLVTAVFALGVGLLVSTLAAFFHDFGLMYQVVLTAWMYATPILYPIEVVPPAFRPLLLLNPAAHLLDLVRLPVHEARLPSAAQWGLSSVMAFTLLAVGWYVFSRARDAIDYRI